ncbi:Peptidase S1, PA clan,Serine proteases, trypsin domain [Cinara cedri]|uniref:Peptidase S1, PA clan,Serine proteases, trypsin domain n=1 Tax=Cinara cedri TaxID=506608 RepID=A0A5E4NKY4_9HEMI|nr:Peptidase S1, PA clan,Serine proteases, trypsin domain [Cinara cedri]
MKPFLCLQVLACFLLLVKCSSINSFDWIGGVDSSISSSEESDEDIEIQPPEDFIGFQYVASALKYPYQVAFVLKGKDSVLCQGALISTEWIITTGSCLKKYGGVSGDWLSAVVGTVSVRNPEAVIRHLSFAVFHPQFDFDTGANDVALVKIKPIVESKNVKPIKLSNYVHPMETKCKYSSSSENAVYGFSLKLLDPGTCDKISLPKQMLNYNCAGVGDVQFMTNTFKTMGSPLVCDERLYSIKTSDGIFTAVNNIDSWVNSVLEKSIETNLG